MPTHFPFENTKVVPWKYDTIALGKEFDEGDEEILEIVDVDVTNIAGARRMTRSGQI